MVQHVLVIVVQETAAVGSRRAALPFVCNILV